MHDDGVAALARDLAERTSWRVRAGVPGFAPPASGPGRAPDVLCERGTAQPPVAFEVELPETLVRRETVSRLCQLVDTAVDTRVVLIAEEFDHTAVIRDGERLLRSAGLEIPVAALAPTTDTLTGADW